MIIDETDYLAHHGVKGMRWGQRKALRAKAKAKKAERNANLSEKQIKAREAKQAHLKEVKKKALKEGLKAGAVWLGISGAWSLHMINKHDHQTLVNGAAFMGKHVGKSMKLAKAATKGAKFAFKKDSVVFSPGTFVPGSFVDAGVRALGQGAKALTS